MDEIERFFPPAALAAKQREAAERARAVAEAIRRNNDFHAVMAARKAFVPSEANYLAVLVENAREREGWPGYKVTLGVLELPPTPDNVLALDEKARILEKPGSNRAHRWDEWQAEDAIPWVRKQVVRANQPRQGVQKSVTTIYVKNPAVLDLPLEKLNAYYPLTKRKADRKETFRKGRTRRRKKDRYGQLEPDQWDALRRADFFRELPERQAEVALLYAAYRDPKHPRETVPAIAATLGISDRVVRKHIEKLRRNVKFREFLREGVRETAFSKRNN